MRSVLNKINIFRYFNSSVTPKKAVNQDPAKSKNYVLNNLYGLDQNNGDNSNVISTMSKSFTNVTNISNFENDMSKSRFSALSYNNIQLKNTHKQNNQK